MSATRLLSLLGHFSLSRNALCYSAILVTNLAFDKGSGMTVVSADVLVDSGDLNAAPLDLPTIIV